MPDIKITGNGGGGPGGVISPDHLTPAIRDLISTLRRVDASLKKITGKRDGIAGEAAGVILGEEIARQTAPETARVKSAVGKTARQMEQAAAHTMSGQAERTKGLMLGKDGWYFPLPRATISKMQNAARRAAEQASSTRSSLNSGADREERIARRQLHRLEKENSARNWNARLAEEKKAINRREKVAGAIGTAVRRTLAVGIASLDLPFLPGQIMRGALATAQPAIDLTKGSYALGRAGGFSGRGLYNTLYPGTGTTQGVEWMNNLMLTAPKVLESMGAYGIAPGSAGQVKDLATTFARSNLSGGFSGLEGGTAERLSRQAVGYGAAPNSAAGLAGYLAPIETTMADAVAKGMDRTKVLANIQDSIDLMAKTGGGIGVSSSSAIELISKLMQTGTAGGRTGQTAFELQSGMSGFVNNPSSAPVGQLMVYSQLPKFGMLKDAKGLEAFYGPKIMEQMNKSPEVKARLFSNVIETAKSGNTSLAMQMAIQGAGADSGMRMLEIGRQAVQQSGTPRGMQDIQLANTFNLPYADVVQKNVADGMPQRAAQSGIEVGFKKSAEEYRAILKASGVSDSMANVLIQAGQDHGLSPVLLASMAKKESGFQQFGKNGRSLYNTSGSGAVGLMQIMPNANGSYPVGVERGVLPNAEEGARRLQGFLEKSGGNVDKALASYGGFKTKDPSAYVGDITGNYRNIMDRSNVPTEIGYAENKASQATLGGANFSLNNFVTAADKITTGMESAGDAATTFAKAAVAAAKELGGIRASTPTGGFDVGKTLKNLWTHDFTENEGSRIPMPSATSNQAGQ